MPLFNCEINLVLTLFDRCFIIDNPLANQEPTFTVEQQNQHLDFLINPSFQGVNRLYV